ncbi:crotonobetainyl-CoA:carnitine CoA-transferase CaiB-like acyl-CoA transferase [Humitalea rosea]|uniref:Crotonobetainyl-CoA:carnitine CoA-transferase CaiB-like acyl-CoA transferase n=1 Tax=Humitalea rosea TaxID=990373 RepID=A0A2W7KJJ2_9PROT|nr:CoA transferase [Humitalea rosea]PZW48116.1 crotonobetainyl-CoA:carnitine CoA-transferase CaiB-like acyl-CoA transferase [Humitalea rosea]
MIAPFAGKRVLDLSALAAQQPHGLAIAMAAKLAAQFGATVVRPVPERGDSLALLPPILPDGSSALARFLLAGRTAGDGRGRFDAAIGDTGALVGIDAALTVRISVFGPGEDPPMSELGLLALSGILSAVHPEGGVPHRLAGHQAAYATGLAAFTALAAGLRAEMSDRAEISLFDTACWVNWKEVATVLLLGSAAVARDKMQRADWHTMRATDGHVALVYMAKDWPALRDLLGDPRLHDPRFATQRARGEHMAELDALMAPWFARRSRAEITAATQRKRVPVGPVLTPLELLDDRQHRSRGFLDTQGVPRLPVLWDGEALTCVMAEMDHVT